MKYYRDSDGNYLGGWDQNPPQEAIEVHRAPDHARQKWADGKWQPLALTQREQDLEDIRNDPAINNLLAKRPSEIASHFGQQNTITALRIQVALLAKQVKLLSGK